MCIFVGEEHRVYMCSCVFDFRLGRSRGFMTLGLKGGWIIPNSIMIDWRFGDDLYQGRALDSENI